MQNPIRFEDVRRSFGGKQVLRGLDFEVRPGEVFALLGRNGCGKTTAIRALLGFLEPDAGSCEVLGRASTALTPDVRERIGYVSEGHVLYPWMSVADVLRFEAGTRTRFDLGQARAAVQRMGLGESRTVRQLSRGQRAQLALSVAMAGRPEVLVLDDPTLGLDVVMRREFLDAMIDVLGEAGHSVLFSSHILSDVERIADRVGLMSDGRLIVDATLEDLKRRVQRRRVRVRDGRAPDVAGVLRARPVAGGYDLLLVDLDSEGEARLAGAVEDLSPPDTPTLEDLFLELASPTGTPS